MVYTNTNRWIEPTYTCSFCYHRGHKYTQCVDPSVVELVRSMDTVYLINYMFISENWYIRRHLRGLPLSSLKMLAHRHAITIAPTKRRNAGYHVQRLLDTVYHIDEDEPSGKAARRITHEMMAKFSDISTKDVEGHLDQIGQYWPKIYYTLYERLHLELRPTYKFPMIAVQLDKMLSWKAGARTLPTLCLSVVPPPGSTSITVTDQTTCPVCLEDIKEDTAVHFNCAHTCCYSCADQYLTHASTTEDRIPRCPTCRSKIQAIMPVSNSIIRRVQCKFTEHTKMCGDRVYDTLAKRRQRVEDDRRVQADLERCQRVIAEQRTERAYWEQRFAPYCVAWTVPYLMYAKHHVSVWIVLALFVGLFVRSLTGFVALV